MNIFAVDSNPVSAAQMLCDKHINKMIIESCQMLCTAMHIRGSSRPGPYRATFKNHPCTVWAATSRENWQWLFDHALALYNEKVFRFGGTHKCYDRVLTYDFDMDVEWPEIGITPFARAIKKDLYPELLTSTDDTILVYQEFYRRDKRPFAVWQRGRSAPAWWC